MFLVMPALAASIHAFSLLCNADGTDLGAARPVLNLAPVSLVPRAQRSTSAERSRALQNRGRSELRPRNGPGPAVHHFVLHRIRGTCSQNNRPVLIGTISRMRSDKHRLYGPMMRIRGSDLLSRIRTMSVTITAAATVAWLDCDPRSTMSL
jgi:hypothetical protein